MNKLFPPLSISVLAVFFCALQVCASDRGQGKMPQTPGRDIPRPDYSPNSFPDISETDENVPECPHSVRVPPSIKKPPILMY